MTELNDLEQILCLSYSVDDCRHDGTYQSANLIKRDGCSSDIMKELWECYNSWPTGKHYPPYKPNGRGFCELSIKRTGDKKKSLIVFKIDKGAIFKKETLPLVFSRGYQSGAFGRSFILMADKKKQTMVAVDPTDKDVTIPDDAWGAIVYDDSKYIEDNAFGFFIDFVPQPKTKSAGDPLFLGEPADQWPGRRMAL